MSLFFGGTEERMNQVWKAKVGVRTLFSTKRTVRHVFSNSAR